MHRRSPPVPDDATLEALARSNLRDVPAPTISALVAVGRSRAAQAGEILHHAGDSRPHLELLVSGLVRVFVLAPDGRTLTVRYVRAGGLVGAVSLFAPSFELPVTIQAITTSHLMTFPPDAVAQAVDRDPRFARAMLTELGERVQSFINEIPWVAFATVRQRIARRLLDLAADEAHGPALTVRISQSQLAAECGTVRGVVVRELHQLRELGTVTTRRGTVTVLDPAALLAASVPDPA